MENKSGKTGSVPIRIRNDKIGPTSKDCRTLFHKTSTLFPHIPSSSNYAVFSEYRTYLNWYFEYNDRIKKNWGYKQFLTMFRIGVSIGLNTNPDTDPTFKVNTDTDPGFLMTRMKIKNICSRKWFVIICTTDHRKLLYRL